MSILTASKINKSYGVEQVLEDVSFTVNEGERIGIVGVNGAGKSTLFRIIAGEIPADSGELFFARDKSLGYLKQRDHFPDGGTVMQEMQKAASEEGKKRFEKERGYSYDNACTGMLRSLAFTDDYFEKPVSKLSGGERTRLALASILLQEPDILLLDEPTNHLDIGTLKWLEGYLASCKSTLLIISHDRYFLDRLTTRIFEIERGRLSAYDGNYSEYKEQKRLRYELDLKHYEHAAAERRRQEDMIRRFKERGTEKLIKRAKSREKRLARSAAPEKPSILRQKLSMSFEQKLGSATEVLIAEDISMSFGKGDEKRQLFSGVNLDIMKGDRICMVGANGVGKTTLLKIIMGKIRPDSGWLKLGQNVIPAYYDQEQRLLDNDKTVLDELHSSYIRYDQTELRSMLGRLGFYGDDVFKRVSELAGGEKAKLSLLKLMMTGANFLIMDEPTNHLDINAREVFEDALLDFPGTLLIVSHDRYLLEKIPTAIYELGPDGIEKYLGNYDYYERKSSSVSSGRAYLEKLAGNAAGGSSAELLSKRERTRMHQKRKEENAARRKLERRLEEAEEAVANSEELIKRIERELCKPEVYSDHERALQLSEELDAAKAELHRNYEVWMELQEEKQNSLA